MSSALALEVENLRVVLGGRVVLDQVGFALAAGRRHAIIGRSGAGKSVLMKAVAGLLPHAVIPARGAVRIHRPPLVFVHQDPALLDTLSIDENIAFAVERSGLSRAEARARVDEVTTTLQLTHVRHQSPAGLSIAVQKRAALARALCLRPGILVVDEPTTGLDPRAAVAVDDALAGVSGTTLVVITHSPRTLERLDPEILVVEDGRVGPPRRSAA